MLDQVEGKVRPVARHKRVQKCLKEPTGRPGHECCIEIEYKSRSDCQRYVDCSMDCEVEEKAKEGDDRNNLVNVC